MDLVIGIALGGAVVFGVIVFAFRNPTRPLQRRNDIDHDGWNDTNGSSSYTNFMQ